MDTTTRLGQDAVGCYVDSTHGIHAPRRVMTLAKVYGWNGLLDLDISEWDFEDLSHYADEAEKWLNDNKASEGYSFGWYDGEFHYQTNEWWQTV